MQKYENGLETKRHIYRVAKKLILENGYRKTSISDICKEAHINRNTLYYHYDSKEEIRNEMLKDFSEKAHYVVNYYCNVPEYESLLSTAVIWYYMLHNAEIARFFREAIAQEDPGQHRPNSQNNWRMAPFYVGRKEEPPVTPVTFWVDGSLQILEQYWIENLPQHTHTFTFEEIIEQEVRITGAMYQIPQELVDACWTGVKHYIDIIPFERLHINF